jgi:DNA-binding transcriptional ArsR family regulator
LSGCWAERQVVQGPAVRSAAASFSGNLLKSPSSASLRMIQMLLQADFTVSQLAEACHLPSAMASEHLRLMQRCGLLASEKDGRKVYYRVVEPHLKNVLHCIEDRFGTDGNV